MRYIHTVMQSDGSEALLKTVCTREKKLGHIIHQG